MCSLYQTETTRATLADGTEPENALDMIILTSADPTEKGKTWCRLVVQCDRHRINTPALGLDTWSHVIMTRHISLKTHFPVQQIIVDAACVTLMFQT